ncbi:MAG: transglycosylase domain-containing protein [Xanthomonadaceae bacterium]|nr:transglycosylase domain-containing protein [Xanthomonadaceae bacterium]
MFGLISGVIGVTLLWLFIVPSLPPVESLRDIELQVPLRVYSADDRLITEIGEQRRIPLSIDEIPVHFKQAFLAAEDDNFYNHPGFDWRGTLRGAIGYARYMGQRRVPGGSTITQQVARRFFLSTEFSLTRKIREIFLAMKIEREMSKDEILELYLNKEFLGHRAYGVGAAAQTYYGKSVDQLSIAEMAMIAGLPQRPSRVNPVTSPSAALERRAYVLRRMRDEGFITESEFLQASIEPDQARLHGAKSELDAPWIAEIARQQAVDRFGAKAAYTRGFHIVTTIDSRLQRAAAQAVIDGLDAYDKRHGWRGPEQTVDPALLESREPLLERLAGVATVGDLLPAIVLKSDEQAAQLLLADGRIAELTLDRIEWAREHIARDRRGPPPSSVAAVLSPGDQVRLRDDPEGWRLAQIPEAQAALVVNDAPVVFDDPSQERSWKPQNFSERFHGPTRLREGMIHSRNLISVRLVLALGLDTAIDYVTGFGFVRDDIPKGPSMALGSASITPLELASAYAVFANGGLAIEPHFLHAIIDGEGRELDLPERPFACADCAGRADRAGRAADTRPIPRDRADAGLPDASLTSADGDVDDAPAPRKLDLSNVSESRASGVDDDPSVDQAALHGPPEPLYARRVISPQTAWLIRSMMSDVITSGTGRRAQALNRGDLSGKTGTTNDQRDTWFSGFNHHLVTTVWVGMDSSQSLGDLEQGGRTALPIWVDYMQLALDGIEESRQPIPVGIVQAMIDPETGERVRPGTPAAIPEWFPAANLPPFKRGSDGEAAVGKDGDPYDVF